jgi:hypothetical protein
MRLRLVKSLVLSALAITVPVTALAAPIRWTLHDVVFLDGVATASGSFVFDADTNTVSDVAIVTTPGPGFLCNNPPACSGFDVVLGAFTGASYDLGFAATPSDDLIITLQSGALGDLTNSTIFQMLFASPLTNAGGTVALVPGAWGEYICLSAACDSFDLSTTTLRTMTGSVSSVPEPATLMLVGTGALALVRRRRRASQQHQ